MKLESSRFSSDLSLSDRDTYSTYTPKCIICYDEEAEFSTCEEDH